MGSYTVDVGLLYMVLFSRKNEHKKSNRFALTALKQQAEIVIMKPEIALDLPKLHTHWARISLPRGTLSVDLKIKVLSGKTLLLCEINTSCHEKNELQSLEDLGRTKVLDF